MKAALSHNSQLQIYRLLLGFLAVGFLLTKSGAHQCNHGHHHHDHHHDHNDVDVDDMVAKRALLLPEEIAEMEDLMMEWEHSDHHHHHHHHHEHGYRVDEMSGVGLWINAMGCSLLVSLASLVCLILLPVIFIKGTPSKTFVDCLAIFGAGAMLGDAFLHQLPHAFGGGHSHSHGQHDDHDHHHVHSEQSHSHSLQDLSVGLSILSGVIVFLIVEKIVRYVEEFSGGVNAGHGRHHHHHHKHSKKLKDDGDATEKTSEEKEPNKDSSRDDKPSAKDALRKRVSSNVTSKDGNDSNNQEISNGDIDSVHKDEQAKPKSSLVFGYLNLFSDGVHNFTDGMALGSAFLLYGSVGGWSRTLFLLAHELPQEIGDFGILVRSGFSVSKALFFNFLSALVALVGTALALIWGKDPGQSSLIEGFTAGGFIYIALAGVLAEMNNNGVSALRSSSLQLISLILGMAVALGISLVE